jgi:hypothetical protein
VCTVFDQSSDLGMQADAGSEGVTVRAPFLALTFALTSVAVSVKGEVPEADGTSELKR